MPMYRWESLDGSGRFDAAAIECTSAGLRCHGSATSPEYSLLWNLQVDSNWVTRQIDVTTTGNGWRRELSLMLDGQGNWSCTASSDGEADFPPPGFACDPTELTAALDCDLGKCPVTNLMPIRRLNLLGAEVPEIPLQMAWIDVPSLQVIVSDQVYASHSATQVSYRSYSRDFAALLEVDGDGMVVTYPDLARQI